MWQFILQTDNCNVSLNEIPRMLDRPNEADEISNRGPRRRCYNNLNEHANNFWIDWNGFQTQNKQVSLHILCGLGEFCKHLYKQIDLCDSFSKTYHKLYLAFTLLHKWTKIFTFPVEEMWVVQCKQVCDSLLKNAESPRMFVLYY